MLNKINWNNGAIVRSDFLNEVQKGTTFSESPRADFYAEPTDTEHTSWSIGSRDKIKEWEISDPTSEPQSALGRLIYDGLVLGYDDVASQVILGPASLVAVVDGYAAWVESGSAILSDGEKIAWGRQKVQLVSGVQVNYIYLSEQLALSSIGAGVPVLLSIGDSLPPATFPHIPLAKLTLNANQDGLLLGTDGEPNTVVGHGYVDLRPSTHIGNLNTYPRNLTNTSILSQSTQIGSWKRAIVDTSNGSIVITLPSTPENSDRVAIADISGTFDRYPVIIRVPDDCDYKVNGSVDDWIVNIRDSHLELYYNIDTNQWKFEESPGGDCNPVMGSFLSCGGKEYIGERLPQECPDGQDIPYIYPNPPEGVYEYDLGSGKCYKNYNPGVAIYANGQGGLITVPATPRCDKDKTLQGAGAEVRNIIYVDPSIGDDALENNGFSADRPFRTPERAIIEATRESRRSGAYNDRYDRILIELSPGDYYVDNSPGSGNTSNLTGDTGLVQRVSTGFSIQSSIQGDRKTVFEIETNNVSSNQPPNPINLGRVLYSASGGVGNISKLEKVSFSSSIWKVTLEYVKGSFNRDDELYYDNLAIVNPPTGGIIVPRGISINGVDLRKVRIRPMYVPTLSPVQNDPQLKTAIWKVTGGSYISLQTFTDNLQYSRTHNTITCAVFASREELAGSETVVSYYAKLNSLFNDYDSWGSEGLEFISSESTIVAPVPPTYLVRQRDEEENQTGFPGGDLRGDSPISYPGATKITITGDPTNTPQALPDVNSTRSSSPYIFNCSVRSIFGLNGLHADGALVDGLKSMVTANFTQVSLQTDPNCYEQDTYYLDPPANDAETGAKRYKTSSADPFKYRNIGFRGNNDAVIQIVSCFVIGNSDHFVSDSGGDLSITNSCSDFGDISLKAIGYKTAAFSQDQGSPRTGYAGTRILEIIPPKPLTYSSPELTLQDIEISTGLPFEYDSTLAGVIASKGPGDTMPSTFKLVVRNSEQAYYNLDNPPTAASMGFNQYAYTKLNSSNEYELVGGSLHPERKRLYVTGFDELANSITFAANIILPAPGSSGFDVLDDRSKIFVWDPGIAADGDYPGRWYVLVDTSGIVETTVPDADGFLLKKLDYAFRYKLLSNPTTEQANLANIDFIFGGSAIKTIRAVDNRSDEERIYKTVLDGFKKTEGIRRPQPYYVIEKQAGVAGGDMNLGADLGDNPLTSTSVTPYLEDGQYLTYMTQGENARRVFEGNLYPSLDYDEPENTEDPVDSITRSALVSMLARPGVWFSSPIGASSTNISVKTSSGVATLGIRIGLRRPSLIRASGHTWEWTGYLNYDTALPAFQNNPLDERFALAKIIDESKGGRVYATGMNEEGNYYIGTTVFDLRSGEQFAIPYKSDQEAGVSNQVFSNVAIRSTLVMKDNSSILMSNNTTIFFSNTTSFKSLTTGNITVTGAAVPGVYATTNRAGLVQLAKPGDLRPVSGTNPGIAKNVVVTAADLSSEITSLLQALGDSIKSVANLRLSLSASSPVPSDNQSGGTLYIHPYNGNEIALWDNGEGATPYQRWYVLKFNSIRSFPLKFGGVDSGSPLTADTQYDIYLHNTGTVTDQVLAVDYVAWGSFTSPPAREEKNGIICKAGDVTRRFVGVVRTTTAGTSEMSLGGVIYGDNDPTPGAPKSASYPKLYLSNLYNKYDARMVYFFGGPWGTESPTWTTVPSADFTQTYGTGSDGWSPGDPKTRNYYGYVNAPRVSFVQASDTLVTAYLDMYNNWPATPEDPTYRGAIAYVAPGIDSTGGPPNDAFYGESQGDNLTSGSQWARALSAGSHDLYYLYRMFGGNGAVLNEHANHGMIVVVKA